MYVYEPGQRCYWELMERRQKRPSHGGKMESVQTIGHPWAHGPVPAVDVPAEDIKALAGFVVNSGVTVKTVGTRTWKGQFKNLKQKVSNCWGRIWSEIPRHFLLEAENTKKAQPPEVSLSFIRHLLTFLLLWYLPKKCDELVLSRQWLQNNYYEIINFLHQTNWGLRYV